MHYLDQFITESNERTILAGEVVTEQTFGKHEIGDTHGQGKLMSSITSLLHEANTIQELVDLIAEKLSVRYSALDTITQRNICRAWNDYASKSNKQKI
jgi:hypothetical protein